MTARQIPIEERILIELRLLTTRRLAAADQHDWDLARTLANERQACMKRLTHARLDTATVLYPTRPSV